MSFLPPVIMQIQANATQAVTSMQTVNTELAAMEVRANAAGASLSRVEKASIVGGVALKAMSVAAVAVGVLSVKAAMEQEVSFARMDEAIKDARDTTASSASEFRKTAAAAIEMGFADDAAAGALGTLVTATGSAQEAQTLLNTTMDLARYKHIDLNTAATIVARGTQGSAKAFKELGITLDTSLPKQEAINKAFDQLNQRIGGQAQAYLDTFAGKMAVLGSKTEQLAEQIGDFLIPYLSKLVDFLSQYGKQILIVVGSIAAAVVAFKLFTTVINVFKAAQIIYIALTAGMAAALTALTFATNGGATATKSMAAAQAILNAVMAVNPYVALATVIGAVVTALVVLYNTNDKVRNAIINTAQVAIRAFGAILPAIGKIVQGILYLTNGPLILLLKGLAGLGFGPAKTALKELESGIKSVGTFFDDSKKKVDAYAESLEKLKKPETFSSISGVLGGAPKVAPKPSTLKSYTGKDNPATAGGGGNTTIVQNVMVYASNTNDISKKLSQAAKNGIPVGKK